MLTAGVKLGDMLRHRDLLSQHAPLCVPEICSVLYSCLCLPQLQPPHPTLSCNVCVTECFCASSQGLARHDAVDPIAATRGERHQHYHRWLCGAWRIHQRRNYPQLSPWWRWRWCHLRDCRVCACVGGRGGDREHSHHRHCFGLCSRSSLFGIYFRRGAALLLSLYLGL